MSGKFKTYNFRNNQYYIKSEKFDKNFFRAKILYYFISSLLSSFILFGISIIIFILIFKSNLFINTGLIYKENLDYLYFNKKFIFFYFFIGLSSLFLIFNKKILLNKLSGESLSKNYDFLNNWKNKLFIIFGILLGILIFIYFSNFLFAKNIFIFGFFILIIHFLFDIKKFSKEKVLIKKPLLGYNKILKSIEKNNITIRNSRKSEKKNIYFSTIIYLGVFITFGFYLFFSIGKLGFYPNQSYYFMSVSLDNLVKNKTLDLENKNLGYESVDNIFDYLKNKNINKIKIGNNNYDDFLYVKNEKKLKQIIIDYGNIENYYKNNDLEKIILDYKKVKLYYKKINFSENIQAKYLSLNYFKNINISEFSDKYSFFKKYYGIDINELDDIKIDFYFNKDSYLNGKRENISIDEMLEKGINIFSIIKEDLEKSRINFIKIINNKNIFRKGFNIKIKNAFYGNNSYANIKDNKELEERIKFFLKINNPNINLSFFDIDNFCKKYKGKFDCNILKQKFEDIGNENIKEILLNNNYILSDYGNFYKTEGYKKTENQQILLDVYFKLKNRNPVPKIKKYNRFRLKKIDLSNNYINSVFFEKIVSEFKNVDTFILGNLESDKKINIDLEKTDIKNFIINNSKIFFQESNKDEKNILIDSNYKKDTYSLHIDVFFPKIFITNKGGMISISGKYNNLFNKKKYSLYPNKTNIGHYKFSEDFLNGLYLQDWNTHKITDYFYSTYFDNIFKDKEITENSINNFLNKYNTDKYFKKQIDFFIKINNTKVDGFYTGLTYDFEKKYGNLSGNEKIKEFLKYMIKSEKFKIYLADYKMFNYFNIKYWSAFENNGKNNIYSKFHNNREIKFQEIYKYQNTYIFVKRGKIEY